MLFLSQRQYIAIILARAIMTNCKPCSTHVDTSSKLPSSDALVENPTHYRSIAGDLQYLTFARPDIAYAVQQACLHMHDSCKLGFNLAKRILRYLKGTIDHGLQLHRTSPGSLTADTRKVHVRLWHFFYQRMKHVEIDLHFIQERVALGELCVLHVRLCPIC